MKKSLAPCLLLLSLLALSCGSPTSPTAPTASPGAPASTSASSRDDDCSEVAAKLMPVLQEVALEAGRELGEREREAFTTRCRKARKRDPMIDCVLAATDQHGVRACLDDGLRAYRSASAASREAVTGARVDCIDASSCMSKAEALDATDPELATEAYYAACSKGAAGGCEKAGLRWMKQADGRHPPPLDARIVDSWRRSCEIGTGHHGCGNLGSAYFFGLWGTPVDGKKGLMYWAKACNLQGNKFICRKLEQAKTGAIQPGVIPP